MNKTYKETKKELLINNGFIKLTVSIYFGGKS